MSNPQLLATYLRDHHAGALGAIELLKRIQESNGDNSFGQGAHELIAAFNHDKRLLEGVMAALDITPSKTKDAGAWVAEKLARLKLNGRIVEYSPLSRVVEFEALSLGISGRIRLCHALQIARQSDQRLADFDFERMLERAHQQRKEIESLHEQACEVAFVEAGRS